MIRSCAILLLILTTAFSLVPSVALSHSEFRNVASNHPLMSAADPAGSLNAFNYTYSQANLYTNASAKPVQQLPSTFPPSNLTGRQITWLNTVNRTLDNTQVTNTGFRFNLTKSGLVPGRLVYNWTLMIPKFNCSGCSSVSVDFNIFGRLTKGTNASYLLSPLSPPNSTRIAFQAFTTVGGFFGASGVNCPENICIDVTRWIGYNVTLSFSFGWNATSVAGMSADVGEITVASISNFIPSATHVMSQDSNPAMIDHVATLSSINYNNTLTTYTQPGNTSRTQLWWHIEVISIYYPPGFTNLRISMNSTNPGTPTQMFPAPSTFPAFAKVVAFETERCSNAPCSEALVALNVSDFHLTAHNSIITIFSNSANSLSSLTTLMAGAPAQTFAPGDELDLKVVNTPSNVNASTAQKTGQLNVTLTDHNGIRHILPGNQTFPVSTASGAVYALTLPTDCSLCGTWSIYANFTSGFDLGLQTTTFLFDQIQATPGSFTVAGDNTGLNIQATLTNSTGASVPTATGVVFAIDEGIPANLPITTTNSSSGGGLYVSNITIINGVFTQGQPLIMTFTISNPGSTSYNASVRIEHEWPGSPNLSHGAYANFTIGFGDGMGDLPLIFGPESYQAAFTLTAGGMHLSLTSLKTGNSITSAVTLGTSPVSPTESQAGVLKVTVTSRSGSSIVSANSLLSSPYAYVVGLPLNPSRFLAFSPTFTGTNLAVKITSNAIVGAKKLVVFALARDSSGRILVNNSLNPGFVDSTVITSTMDKFGQVAKGQTASATIHLTSNASKITQIITINLNLEGSGVVASQTGVTITPGTTQTVTLPFIAPSTPGQYLLSFSSPQYNNNLVLASQTIQVTILQSNLQILIPAAIGIVAAIIVLSVYLLRRQPDVEAEEETKTRPGDQKTRPSPKGPPAKSLTRTSRL